jgi:hypothetical protein
VVIAIESDTKAGAVRLLQNFEPPCDYNDDTYSISVAGNKDWGLFLGHWDVKPPPMQMTGVKIADKIADKREGGGFTMDEYFTTKYELLQAVIQERREGLPPVIIRQRTSGEIEEEVEVDVSGLRIGNDDY